MNHEELLAKIEDQASYQTLIKTLRAVVELHKPWDYTYFNGGKVSYCGGCPVDSENGQPEYPCLTIQVIEKELQ